MSKLHTYFTRGEFACRCGCGNDTVDYELLNVLIDLRLYFNKPVNINSAFRCIKHNTAVMGEKASYHLTGKAADVYVTGVNILDVYSYLTDKYVGKYGLILYKNKNFVHIDVRETEYRDLR